MSLFPRPRLPPQGGPQPLYAPPAQFAPATLSQQIAQLEAAATALRQAILTNGQYVAANATAPGAIPPATLQWLQSELQIVVAAQTLLTAGQAPPKTAVVNAGP